MSNNNSYKSVLGYNWRQKPIDERHALTIHQKHGCSQILSRLLAHKNIALEEVEIFLNPTIRALLPDPFTLLDMDIAAAKIISAVKNKGKIVIFGDYDVDGATSSALLKRFLAMIGANAQIYIPDRILEGYGPNAAALLKLKEQGADLLITVDCGTVAFAPLEAAHQAGLEIIVIDHHLGALEKPKAIAIINPNRLDENFADKNLAAVGVCFLLCVAINKLLREENFYEQNKLSEPQLLSLLDLVALGTVCDVVPLIGINRALVAQGLKLLKTRQNIGLRAVCDIANLDEEPNSYHLGFILGPRINAGGRVGEAHLGADLLSNNDEEKVKSIAAKLDSYNKQRKIIEETVLQEAIAQIEKNKIYLNEIIIAFSPNWHPGVIGIVASRIKELYEKPTIIIAIKDDIGKASCRSIVGIDLGGAIVGARLNGILIDGGGHKMAAGFTIEKNKISALQKFLNEELGNEVARLNQGKSREFADILDITSANLNLAKEINSLEPFGSGNAKPKFMIKDLLIIKSDLIGADKSHISCLFSSKNLNLWQGKLKAVAFGAAKNALGDVLMAKNKSETINAIGQININNWMGNENVQLVIEDLVKG